MNGIYKLGSLFDGIGGWPLAAIKFGINPVWSSEIELFPQEVTKRHFPSMKHLGDITKINGAEIDPVDIICMGSPCQDLSIAGKRKGLDGERSGLFRTAINIIRDMRRASNGKYPRFVVWENVPGAFSSNKGNDFRAVLKEITEAEIPMPRSGKWATAGMVRSDKCEVAWRVLDAQHWGVPQRRKRIFLVADFGGRCAGEILFKSESLPGDFTEGSGERKRTTGRITDCLGATVVRMRGGCEGGGKGALVSVEKSLTLAANTNDQTLFQPIITGTDLYNLATTGEVACTLACNMRSAGASGPSVLQPITFSVGNLVRGADASPDNSGVCKTLRADMGDQHPCIAEPKIWDMTHADEVMRPVKDGIVPTLNARMGTGGNQVPVVQETAYCVGNGQLDQAKLSSKVGALNCMHDQQAVMINYKVRRLTPTECERLQGLPEGYTRLIEDKKYSDSARYKALGNGMAQPCPDFVMQGIADILRRQIYDE